MAAFAIGPDMQAIWRASGRRLSPASVEIVSNHGTTTINVMHYIIG